MTPRPRFRPALLALALIYGVSMNVSMPAAQAPAHTVASEDEQAVRQVIAGYEEAWNRHDMTTLGRLFADDAEWVNIVGMWWRGRADVEKAHRAFHETMFRETPLIFSDVSVRFVAPGVAVAITTIEMGDFTTPEGHAMLQTRDRCTFVVARRGGEWKIVSGHNTVISPAAAPHDPVNGAGSR